VKATRFEFRYRVAIICTLYFLGFFAPWERFGASATVNPVKLWSWLALNVARTGLLSVADAYLLVTAAAVVLALLGALLRVWGTAYLGHAIMRNPAMQAGAVMASGPYRYLRNPLYAGMALNSLAVSILMPATGALFFLAGFTVFIARLIGGEEAFLAGELGETYREYRSAVPSLLPRARSRLPASTVKARWGQSLRAEVYAAGTAACFAVLAWRYDANLLTRFVIVCFGISLVLRALTSSREDSPAQAS
jgi:protein-S-isoprenylcysteine O-methyltransferase Ste14